MNELLKIRFSWIEIAGAALFYPIQVHGGWWWAFLTIVIAFYLPWVFEHLLGVKPQVEE